MPRASRFTRRTGWDRRLRRGGTTAAILLVFGVAAKACGAAEGQPATGQGPPPSPTSTAFGPATVPARPTASTRNLQSMPR
jgi:hypothetical protein